MVSIIIPTFNLCNILEQCLLSIYSNTNPKLIKEVIVIDNGSTDWTPVILRGYKDVKVITNTENLGYGPACNQGLDLATGEYVCFLNNDVTVTPGWLPGLLWYMKDRRVGAVGPMSNNVSGDQNISPFEYEPNPTPYPTTRLVGHCLLVRKSVLDQIGGFDTVFINAFEDDDLCLRIVMEDRRLLIARDVFVYHQGSMTFRAHKETMNYEQILSENHMKFRKKWSAYMKNPLEVSR